MLKEVSHVAEGPVIVQAHDALQVLGFGGVKAHPDLVFVAFEAFQQVVYTFGRHRGAVGRDLNHCVGERRVDRGDPLSQLRVKQRLVHEVRRDHPFA